MPSFRSPCRLGGSLTDGLATQREGEAVDGLGLRVDRRDDVAGARRERAVAHATPELHARRVVLGRERVDLRAEPEPLLRSPAERLPEREHRDDAAATIERDGRTDGTVRIDEEPGAQAAVAAGRVVRAPDELDGRGRVAEADAREAYSTDQKSACGE